MVCLCISRRYPGVVVYGSGVYEIMTLDNQTNRGTVGKGSEVRLRVRKTVALRSTYGSWAWISSPRLDHAIVRLKVRPRVSGSCQAS